MQKFCNKVVDNSDLTDPINFKLLLFQLENFHRLVK